MKSSIKYVKRAKMWARTTFVHTDKKINQKIEWFNTKEEALNG